MSLFGDPEGREVLASCSSGRTGSSEFRLGLVVCVVVRYSIPTRTFPDVFWFNGREDVSAFERGRSPRFVLSCLVRRAVGGDPWERTHVTGIDTFLKLYVMRATQEVGSSKAGIDVGSPEGEGRVRETDL